MQKVEAALLCSLLILMWRRRTKRAGPDLDRNLSGLSDGFPSQEERMRERITFCG